MPTRMLLALMLGMLIFSACSQDALSPDDDLAALITKAAGTGVPSSRFCCLSGWTTVGQGSLSQFQGLPELIGHTRASIATHLRGNGTPGESVLL